MARDRRVEKSDPRMVPREDEGASPLGRGANPGPSAEAPMPSASRAGDPLHGAGVPGERGGPDGLASRENEDAVQAARDERG